MVQRLHLAVDAGTTERPHMSSGKSQASVVNEWVTSGLMGYILRRAQRFNSADRNYRKDKSILQSV